jgi:hypothetical protein
VGFEVRTSQESRVTLIAEQGGVEHTLVHVLRQPTASELRDYSRMRSEVEVRRRRAALKRSPAEADEWLWDQIALCVEGYTVEGRNLTADMPEWKSLVPLLHKVEAVASVCAVAADEDEELGKESSPSSDAS